MIYPKSLYDLIESFKQMPGVGEKTAERMAFTVLDFDLENAEIFSTSILEVKKKIKKCSICNHLTEDKICSICRDSNRNKEIICVVEEPKNVFMMEKLGTYNGIYHVLGGLISPLKGINLEDVSIASLIERIKKEKIKEVIIVVKPSIEGETTALYILKMLEGTGVKVSKIAQGIPVGADMDYIDSLTLEKAIEQRTEIS